MKDRIAFDQIMNKETHVPYGLHKIQNGANQIAPEFDAQFTNIKSNNSLQNIKLYLDYSVFSIIHEIKELNISRNFKSIEQYYSQSALIPSTQNTQK